MSTPNVDLHRHRRLAIMMPNWLGDAVTGDLGTSYVTDEPVSEIIRNRLPVTLELAVLATVIALTSSQFHA